MLFLAICFGGNGSSSSFVNLFHIVGSRTLRNPRMNESYKEIPTEQLKIMAGDAWSIENMDAHGAGGRTVEYIGSRIANCTVYDYYKDSTGGFWFKNRALLPTGEIISMERRIFGRELKSFRKAKIRKTK